MQTLTQSLTENRVFDESGSDVNQQYSNTDVAFQSDVELLALLLTGRTSTRIGRAKMALEVGGSISGILNKCKNNPGEISSLVGDGFRTRVEAVFEIAQRGITQDLSTRDVLSNPDQVRQHILLHTTGLQHECFGAMFLDNRHRVLEFQPVIFSGTIDSAAVYPREIIKLCLRNNSAAVIFFHNHPSGVAEPSDSDVRLTRKLIDALNLIDVRCLDHLVAGQGQLTSLAERGLM